MSIAAPPGGCLRHANLTHADGLPERPDVEQLSL